MNDEVDLKVLHERMVEETGRFFGGEVMRVTCYERFRERMECPVILFDLEAAPRAEEAEIGTGQMVSDLDFCAYVVVDGMEERAALSVRRLAMRLKGFLFRNNFGLSLPWPVVGDARDAEFEWPKAIDNANLYEIWKVEFSYSGAILGANCWEE